MKRTLLIYLFFMSMAAAKAQDKIITIQQDTIQCHIVSVNTERISYEQKTADNYIVGKSISTSEVLQYFRTDKPESIGKNILHPKVKRARPEHRWLFSIQGGLSHSLTDYDDLKNRILYAGNSASETNDYFSKLKNGYHFNSSLHYLVSSFFGLGVDYNLFYAASKGDFMSFTNEMYNLPVYTKLGFNEKLYYHFAGASLLFQQFPDSKRKIKISETLSPGIVMLRDESRNNVFYSNAGGYGSYYGQSMPYYDQVNSLGKSTDFGAKGSLSVEYALTPQLSAGVAGNFMWAKLHKISSKNAFSEIKDQELENPLNCSHIDYGLVIRYNF
jgi:hypothetical protein